MIKIVYIYIYMKIAKTVGYKSSVSKSYNDSYFQGQRILDLVLKLHSSTTLFVQRKVFLSVQISNKLLEI